MKLLRTAIVTVLLVVLSGCVVHSSQLSGLISLFSSPELDLAENSWSVRYGDYQAVVYAIAVPDGTSFSNSTGDQIFFDGWSIRQFKLMRAHRAAYVISDTVNERTFSQDKRVMAVHHCLEWVRQQRSGKTQFSQSCAADTVYTNSVLVAEDGSISIIRQVVDNTKNAMTLTKLN